MKTYWDHARAERAALTRNEVEQLLKLELMEHGISNPGPLLLEEVTEPVVEKHQYFRVTYDGTETWGRQQFDVLFSSHSQAQAFLDLQPIATKYYLSETRACQIREPAITSIDLSRYEDMVPVQSQAAEYEAAKVRNRKLAEDHAKDVSAAEKACEYIWEDWQECKSRAEMLDRVRATFAEYCEMADDEETARKFLLKAYDDDVVAEAIDGISSGEE